MKNNNKVTAGLTTLPPNPIQSMKALKEIYSVLHKDIEAEGFTKREFVIFGIIAPLTLIAACVLAEWLNTL